MNNQGLIFKRNAHYEKCPSCSAIGSLRRSRPRNFLEKVIKYITPYGTFRCRKCGWRGYRIRITLTKQSAKNAIMYLLMIVFSAFIIYQVLKRFI